MKQKLLSMLTLLLVCCCALQIRAAEILPPTEPEWTETAVAPQSGHVYYIKSVDDGYYLRKDPVSYDYLGISRNLEDARGYVFSKSSSGWSMMSVDKVEYLEAYSSYSYLIHNNTLEADCYWKFDNETSADGHFVMKAEGQSNYSETNKYWYISGSYIYVKGSSSNAKRFVFIDAEARERYLASKKLYDAILMVQSKNLYVSSYESFYNERYNHTVAEIYAQADELIAGTNVTSYSGVVSTNNELPLLIYPTSGEWNRNSRGEAEVYIGTDQTASLCVKFKADKSSSLFWNTGIHYNYDNTSFEIFVDGVKTEVYANTYELKGQANRRFFVDIEAGEHIVEWKYKFKNSRGYKEYISMSNIGVMQSPLITVSLAEPGSLGTEVLYNVDGVKDVKALKVIGRMNGDDWAKIAMMDNLMNLDLSEAIITEVPVKALSRAADASFGFLHNVVLPEGLIKIGNNAFDGTYLKTVNIPSTVTTIGERAFQNNNIMYIAMPNSVNSIGMECFNGCSALRKVVLSNSLTSIPKSAFYNCYALTSCDLPEGITSIGTTAFYYNYSLSQTLPSTLEIIGDGAYDNCWNLCSGSNGELIIPESVRDIYWYAFNGCTDIATVDLPTKFYAMKEDNRSILSGCENVTKIILRSPTLITHTYESFSYTYWSTLGCDLSKVDLFVPDYLVPNYKLDEYWYNYKTITGFETSKIQDWTINNPLVMTDRGRFLGTPDITINGDMERMPSLKIFGEAPMTIKNLKFGGSYSWYINYPGQILSNCSKVSIIGDVQTDLYTEKNNWYFFSLPFDIKISEITHDVADVKVAVRYFDGATRAVSGSGGNWKNYDEDAIIEAGTGFIMQTSATTWNYFHAIDNENKQQSVKNVEFVKTLGVNDSQIASNKGWNLVGNPWQCYYNDHALNFTGPITVWNANNRTYSAYSIIDDDYAIRPNEAFFVQCPSAEYNTIGFPTQGRQVTNVIENQNAAKPLALQEGKQRKLVNVVISNGADEDQTRVVLNENASMEYELSCDASKMMSMDASVPQIYSLDEEGTEYAINERPLKDGVVALGAFFPKEGEYTIRLERNDAETVMLLDNETDETYSLTAGEYSFYASAGTNDSRFSLVFNPAETTGVGNVNIDRNADKVYYNLYGQRVQKDANGIVVMKGKKYFNKK